ncbi:hypothetical protein [Scytonema millei]|uniref:Uncharacterized protein n=1 Tax=Scytonema millei VB511283 TaxID=1245923 RepID=A0A9X5E9M4_9CYAN|nr:hypothetical protein [Scytonema millei]NHC37826.1 hypothetical protein [Scytonema millei VB511283]
MHIGACDASIEPHLGKHLCALTISPGTGGFTGMMCQLQGLCRKPARTISSSTGGFTEMMSFSYRDYVENPPLQPTYHSRIL